MRVSSTGLPHSYHMFLLLVPIGNAYWHQSIHKTGFDCHHRKTDVRLAPLLPPQAVSEHQRFTLSSALSVLVTPVLAFLVVPSSSPIWHAEYPGPSIGHGSA
ncbi:uncharacterized protein F4822DRAFT_299914 [Hypoxylon trugodes]|uniref:uncharacterized protein n=1 Tax=Hypoxylon trugodes TaxID=326681 RepID=UPI00219857F5|nr:uncharacterized protein F4822DRAFT_299914 [Hypoxylon trugodes]KAI1388013.1 hypothetical protein F4822DRAFT_299914 [Hypoxylon trugodes]